MSKLLLAIETTGLAGGVALARAGQLVDQAQLPPGTRSAQSLVPTIDRLLARHQLTPRDLGQIAVAVGPGSFTGLRVGVVTAKTLAYALGAEVLAIGTLEVVAAQAELPADQPIEVVLDAGRRQLFWGRLAAGPEPRWLSVPGGAVVDAAAWLAGLAPGAVVSGPGLARLSQPLPPQVRSLPRENWEPRAATVAQLAALRFARGERDDLWRLAPNYLRSSAAEEKAAARAANQSAGETIS